MLRDEFLKTYLASFDKLMNLDSVLHKKNIVFCLGDDIRILVYLRRYISAINIGSTNLSIYNQYFLRFFKYFEKYFILSHGVRKNKGKKKIFVFLEGHGTEISFLSDLNKKYDLIVIVNKFGLIKLLNDLKDVPYTSTMHFLSSSVKQSIKQDLCVLENYWRVLKKTKEFNLLNPRLKQSISFYFTRRRKVADTVLKYEVIKSVIEKEKPDLILSDKLLEYSYLKKMMKKYNVKELTIQHGFHRALRINPIFNSFDVFGVYDDETKNDFIKNTDLSKEQIRVVGSPKFGYLKKINKYDLNESDFILLNTTIHFELIDVERIISIIREVTNRKIIIKIHPNEIKSKYRTVLNKFEKIDIYDNHLYSLIAACRFVVSCHSTTTIESNILGKQVIRFEDYSNDELLKNHIRSADKKPKKVNFKNFIVSKKPTLDLIDDMLS